MNCQKYTKNSAEKITKLGKEDGNPLQKRVKGKIPMLEDYHPDLDTSNELEDSNTHLQMIGIIRWACKLYRIYILIEVSVISQNLCNPREGHIDAVFQIFNYLNVNRKSIIGKLGFDDLEQTTYNCPIKGVSTEKKDGMDFYPDVEERLTNRIPDTFQRKVRIRAYVDANHTENLVNRRSHSGIIIYMNTVKIL